MVNFTEEQIRKKIEDILLERDNISRDYISKQDTLYKLMMNNSLTKKIDKIIEEKHDYYKQAVELLEREGI